MKITPLSDRTCVCTPLCSMLQAPQKTNRLSFVTPAVSIFLKGLFFSNRYKKQIRVHLGNGIVFLRQK